MGREPTLTEFFEVLLTPDEMESTVSKTMELPIVPHDNDVLMGRGGKNNQHVGNEKLRALARRQCDNYRMSTKKGKSYISRDLVKIVRAMHPPGRFLKKNSINSQWEDVGDEVAREKASQALRDAVSAQMSNPKNASPQQLDESMEAISQEHRRSSSDPCMSSSPKPGIKRERNYIDDWREVQQAVEPDYVSSRGRRHVPVYSTPRDLPPVTPATITSAAKRRRYVPPTNPHQFYHLPVPGSPIQMSSHSNSHRGSNNLRARYPVQQANHHPPDFDSPGVILGEIQGDGTEFDLFNGELLEVDVDPTRGPDSPGLRSDTF